MTGLRAKLKDVSIEAFRRVENFDNQTSGWLSPLLAIPMILTFKAATTLETKSEKEQRLVLSRENELLFAARKMIYNPVYYLGTPDCRETHLRSFKGDLDTYTPTEMQDFLENDFSKIWGSALVFGSRKDNINFISHYAIQQVGDRNDMQNLKRAIDELTANLETFGYEVDEGAKISTNEIIDNIKTINIEREAKIKELASTALFVHGFGVSENSYNNVRADMMAQGEKDWLQRYDITPDDVLNYAIDNAEEIIETKFSDTSEKSKYNLRLGMSKLKAQRDGTSSQSEPYMMQEI